MGTRLHQRTRWLLASLAITLSCCLVYACGPAATVCTSDAQCLNGFYCADTGAGEKICVRSTSQDGGTTANTEPSTDTNTSQPDSGQTGAEPNVQPDNNTSPGPDTVTPQPDTSTPPPDRQPPTGSCKIPAYNPANDPGNGGQPTSLDSLDKAFFKKLYDIYYVSKNCADMVWGGGYLMHKVPTYLANVGSAQPGTGAGQKGFLINHPNPPSGSTLVDSKLVFGIPNVYRYDGSAKGIPDPGFDFGYSVGGLEVYAFEYGTGDDWVNPTLSDGEAFALFLHEAFHRVQDYEESWSFPPGNQDTNGYDFGAEISALALLVDQALMAGVTNKATADNALKIYYAARFQRIQMDKSSAKLVKNLDNFQEWLEGTALYAEELYMKVLGYTITPSNPNSIAGRLVYFGAITPQNSRDDLINTMFARFYATGGAVGLLLDKLGDTTWKDKIRRGQTFYDIVAARYSSISAEQRKQILDTAKQTYNYTNKLLPVAKTFSSKK